MGSADILVHCHERPRGRYWEESSPDRLPLERITRANTDTGALPKSISAYRPAAVSKTGTQHHGLGLVKFLQIFLLSIGKT